MIKSFNDLSINNDRDAGEEPINMGFSNNTRQNHNRRRRKTTNKSSASSGMLSSEIRKSDFDKESSTTASSSRGSSSRTHSGRRKDKKNKQLNSNKQKQKSLPEEDVDPYDSDPGESYRQHCFRMKGISTKTCMPRINIFNSGIFPDDIDGDGNGRFSNSPPPSLSTEPEDPLSQIPDSLQSNFDLVPYSFRTSIGDGSENQPSGPNVMDRRELRPNGVQINVSHWSATGCRPYMEDRYAVEDLGSVQVEVSPVMNGGPSADAGVEVTHVTRRQRRLKMPLTWLGIYDGHGGEKASQYCADWMSAYVKNQDTFPHDLGYAMKNAYNSIDKDFVNTGQPDGSTACSVSLVGGRRIVCANAGDSRAIVIRKDGSIVRLSRDHKPGMPDETRRISELGGKVIYWGRWRVEGLLAVSRSIGDASLKPYITSEPEVCEYDVGKDDWFLVVSSDGVWDVIDNEEAAHVVIATSCVMVDGKMVIDTDRFKWAARNLCDHAKSCGSTDNFSAIVVDLQSCGNTNSTSGRYEPK